MGRKPTRSPNISQKSKSKRNNTASSVKSTGKEYAVNTKRGKKAYFKTKVVTNVKGDSFKILPSEQYEYKRLLDNYNKAIKSFKNNVNSIYTTKSNGMFNPETYAEVYGENSIDIETRKLDYSMFTTKKQFKNELNKLKNIDKVGSKNYLLKRMSKNKSPESRMHDVFGQSAEAEIATELIKALKPEQQYYALKNHDVFAPKTIISPPPGGDESYEARIRDSKLSQLSNIYTFVRNMLEQELIYGEYSEIEDYDEAGRLAKEKIDKVINNSLKIAKKKNRKLKYKNLNKKDMKKILGD